MKGIFISYRRDDTSGYARLLYERLAREFGGDQIFMDVETLREPGLDFVDALEQGIGQCAALLALIGKNWLTSEDRHGHRRLDKENDFVRTEIAAALARETRVIPILVQGARMPEAGDLPDDLALLARRQALTLSHEDWEHDVGKLIVALEKLPELERRAATGPAEPPPAPAAKPKSGTGRTVSLAVAWTLVAVFVVLGWIGYSIDEETQAPAPRDQSVMSAEPAQPPPGKQAAATREASAPAAVQETPPALTTAGDGAPSRSEVRAVQESLAALGYDPGPADGSMGAATRTAIREFQDDEGFPVSGRITPALQTQLADATLDMLDDGDGIFDLPAGAGAAAGASNLSGTWYDDNGIPVVIEQTGTAIRVGTFDILMQQFAPTGAGSFENGRLVVQYTNNLGQSGTVTARLADDGVHLRGTDTDRLTGNSTPNTWHREHLPGQ